MCIAHVFSMHGELYTLSIVLDTAPCTMLSIQSAQQAVVGPAVSIVLCRLEDDTMIL